MRNIFINFFFLFLSISCLSQDDYGIDCKWENATKAENISVFIKGKNGQKDIKWKFFYKDFELELSDKSYKIVKFSMTWFLKRKEMLVSRPIKGNVVTSEIEDDNIEKRKNYSLHSIEPGTYIAFDTILIEKNGICYRATPFLINTVFK